MKTKRNPNRGFCSERVLWNRLEAAFADLWENENRKRPGINFGQGLLQDLFFKDHQCVHTVTPKQRFVTATAIQWLGSNCGFSFLQTALSKCGYRIVGREPRDAEPVIEEMKLLLSRQEALQATFDESEPT